MGTDCGVIHSFSLSGKYAILLCSNREHENCSFAGIFKIHKKGNIQEFDREWKFEGEKALNQALFIMGNLDAMDGFLSPEINFVARIGHRTERFLRPHQTFIVDVEKINVNLNDIIDKLPMSVEQIKKVFGNEK
jgi:hypothetical protein